jgi:hypothetical protein
LIFRERKVMKKSVLVFIGAAVLIISSITASAVTESDDTDDIWYIEWDLDNLIYKVTTKGIADHPEIDITSVSATLDVTTLTLSITLDGDINSQSFAVYSIYYGIQNTTFYVATYTPFSGIATYAGTGIDGYTGGTTTATISEDQKTISISFDVTETDESYNLWGITVEYSSIDDMTSGTASYYYDVAPLSYAVEYEYTGDVGEGEDDQEDNETEEPGVNETDDGLDDEPVDSGEDDGEDGASGDDGTTDTGDGEETEDNGTPGFEIITLIAAIGVAFILLRKKKK